MARHSGIYTNITTPKKQQTKVGLQKNPENGAKSAVHFFKEMLINDLVYDLYVPFSCGQIQYEGKWEVVGPLEIETFLG